MTPSTLTLPQALELALREHREGRLAEAEAIYGQILAVAPQHPRALHSFGVLLQQKGEGARAVELIRRAIALEPGASAFHDNLGVALRMAGKVEEALAAHREASRLEPGWATPWVNVAMGLQQLGRLGEAEAACRTATGLQPELAEAHSALGRILAEEQRFAEASGAYRESLRLKPGQAEVRNNLGTALQECDFLDEALAEYREALRLAPGLAAAHLNLANLHKDSGRMGEAVEGYRKALALQPGDARFGNNLVYAMQFDPGSSAAAIREEHRRWNECYVAPVRALFTPHRNARDPARRLKVGYVSPNFWEQAECYFVVPLFEAHDHERFEIHAYASVRCPDAMTSRLRLAVDVWHEVSARADTALAEQIRADGIDVLIDLTMHMDLSQLTLFALQPAPVQASWLAYPGSTGVEAIGYWLTDAHMEPVGREEDSPGGGEPVRLPDSWCCYDPVTPTPEVSPLPALAAGHVTFGSLNNPCKVNSAVLARWAAVLAAVPGSRLLLLCPPGEARRRIAGELARLGVKEERVEFLAHLSRWDYLRVYERIDLALDPFPYNGITTTCDALWMGVPVLTLPGKMPASRAGLSLLTTMGLPELALASEEEYVAFAATLAADLPRLAALRATLRDRMKASPLTDAARFARNMEGAYRAMWERWCKRRCGA